MALASLLLNAQQIHNLQLSRLTVDDGLSQGTIYQIMQDDFGLIWFATGSGIDIYDGRSFRRLDLPSDIDTQIAYNLKQDSQGLIWINVGVSGLYIYDPKSGEFTHIAKTDMQNDKYLINGLAEGENDVVWISTFKTILKYDRSSQSIDRVLDLSSLLDKKQSIQSLLYHEQLLFLATTAGAVVFDIENNKWFKLPNISKTATTSLDLNSSEIDKIYNLFIDNNTLYLGTNDGLFSLNINGLIDKLQRKTPLPDYHTVVPNIETWAFKQYQRKLYVSSVIGLSVVDLDSQQAQHLFGLSESNEQITENKIISIEIDHGGDFWLGSNATGVYKWRPEREKIRNYLFNKNNKLSLSNNEVWAISPTPERESAWVGTSNGLNFIDFTAETIEHYLVGDNVKNLQYTKSHIFGIDRDNNDRLWLTTGKGLKLFDIATRTLLPLPFEQALVDDLSEGVFVAYVDQRNTLWALSYNDIYQINLSDYSYRSVSAIVEKIGVDDLYDILGFLPDSNEMLLSSHRAMWTYDVDTEQLTQRYQSSSHTPAEWSAADSYSFDKNNTLWFALTQLELTGLDANTYAPIKLYDKRSHPEFNFEIYGVQSDSEGDIWFSNHNGIYYYNVDTQHLRNFGLSDGIPTTEFNGGAFATLASGKLVYGSMAGLSVFDPIELKRQQLDSENKVYLTNINTLSRDFNKPLHWQVGDTIALNYDDVGIRFDFSTFSFAKDNTQFQYKLSGRSEINYPLTKDSSITFAELSSGSHVLEVSALSPITGEFSPVTRVKINVSYAPWASPLAYTFYAIALLAFSMMIFRKRLQQRRMLLEAHEQVKVREKRLQLALVGSNSDVWEWQAHDNTMLGNRINNDLGYQEFSNSYPFAKHVNYIHPDDKDQFIATWHNFLESQDLNESFSCIYRMRHTNGDWLWYKDLGKIVKLDQFGQPERVTGSYMNITQSRADEERAQYFGDAFRQTKDWVLIISDNFTKVTANQAFRDIFNWREEQSFFNPDLIGLHKDRWRYYRKLLPTLTEGDYWRGEEVITSDEGKEYHVLVNINVSRHKRSNNVHYVCIFTDITAQKTAEHELRYLANYDHLTNLPNRSLLLERIKHAMDYSKRMNVSIALFFIDLDKFKQVNDTIGHDCGDLLLIETTKRLNDVLRVDDTIARIGGDEFVVLLESFRGSSHLGKIAQKIIAAVEQPVTLKGNEVAIGASIGISLYPDDAKDCDELLRNADVAMYQAKQIGRNTFQFFTPRMNFEADLRIRKETNLKLAQKNNEFVNYYQPVVNSQSNEVLGCELLLRWQTSEGLLLPAEFIELAEELRVITEITEAAIERAFTDLVAWREINPDFFVSVNLSNAHFIDDSLLKKVIAQLKQHSLPAQALRFEITESALISEPEHTINAMRAFVAAGITLVLDDFGLGYSSMSYLKKLPLAVLKIDRSFVAGIDKERADSAIVEAIAVLSNSIGIDCIAVGVETSQQLAFVNALGVDLIQGYLYCQPLNADQLTQFLLTDQVGQQTTTSRV